jgi:hypothetical protein
MEMAPENCAVLSHYTASSGNLLPTFRATFKTIEDGPNSLSRNVGNELPLLAE